MTTVTANDHPGGVRVLTLDRPPANAISEDLLTDLSVQLAAAGRDEAVRAVVLTGAGAFFSGGFDLGAAPRDAAATRRMNELYRDAHAALLGFPKPTVAMLNGHATAGGLVLVLACDYRLGRQGEYTIGLNEVAIGASFPLAAFEIVALRLPHARASELLLGAALYPSSQALRLGVVDELFPDDQFEATVLRRAARLGSFPRQSYAHTKWRLVSAALARIAAEPAAEAERAAAVWMTDESRAARHAQRAKLGMKGGG
ncbi:MAG: enoyl-CoA hydratase/isomerase family protein [Candidatus Binatia bacterium]